MSIKSKNKVCIQVHEFISDVDDRYWVNDADRFEGTYMRWPLEDGLYHWYIYSDCGAWILQTDVERTIELEKQWLTDKGGY